MAIFIAALLVAVGVLLVRPSSYREKIRGREGKEMAAVLCNLRRCYPGKTEAWRWERAKQIMQARGSRTDWS